MRYRSLTFAAALVFAFGLLPNAHSALAASYTIKGQVTDPNSTGVGNVIVGLETTQGTFVNGYSATANGSGNYEIDNVPSGSYYVGVHADPNQGQVNAPQYLRVDTLATVQITASNSSFNLTVPEVAETFHAQLGPEDGYAPAAGVSFDVSAECPQGNASITLAGLPATACSAYTSKADSNGNHRTPEALTDNNGNATYLLFPTSANPYGTSQPNPFLYTVTAHSYSQCGYGVANYSSAYSWDYTVRSSFCPWSWAPYAGATNVAADVQIHAGVNSAVAITLSKPQTLTGRVASTNNTSVSAVTVSLEVHHNGPVVAQAKTDANGNYSLEYQPGSYYVRIEAQPSGVQQNAAQSIVVETTDPQNFPRDGTTSDYTTMADGYAASSYIYACGTPSFPLEQWSAGCYYEYFGQTYDANNTALHAAPAPWPAQKYTTSLNVTVPEHKVHVTVYGETTNGTDDTLLSSVNLGATNVCPNVTDPWGSTLALTATINSGTPAQWHANGCSFDFPQSLPLHYTSNSGTADLWLLDTLPNPNKKSGPYTIKAVPSPGTPGANYVSGEADNVDVNADENIGVVLKHVRPTFSCASGGLLQADGTAGGYAGWSGREQTYACTAVVDVSDSSTPQNFPSTFTLTTSVGSNATNSDASTGTQNVCDGAGFCVTAGPYLHLHVDRTAPSVPTATCQPDPIKWYSPQAGIPCSASDAGSGLLHATDSFFKLTIQQDPSTLAWNTVSHPVCDHVGNCTNAPSYTNLRVDITPPTYSCGAPDTNWHSADQSVECNASDTGGSGLATPSAFTLSTKVPAGASSASAYTQGAQICDLAGNCTTASPVGPFKVDKQLPTITSTSPVRNATLLLNQVLSPSATCQDGIAGSGVASCSYLNLDSNGHVQTGSVGNKSLTLSVSDNAGNVGTASSPYTVTYGYQMLSPQALSVSSGGPIVVAVTDVNGSNEGNVGAVTAIKLTQASSPSPKNFSLSKAFTFANGAYSLNLTGWTPGSYTLYFTVQQDQVVHAIAFTFQ